MLFSFLFYFPPTVYFLLFLDVLVFILSFPALPLIPVFQLLCWHCLLSTPSCLLGMFPFLLLLLLLFILALPLNPLSSSIP